MRLLVCRKPIFTLPLETERSQLFALLPETFDQFAGRHIQGGCDLIQDHHSRVANPAFDTADISSVQSALEGKRLLRKPAFPPDAPEICADLLTYIHEASEADMLTFSLQTISLFSLDFTRIGSNECCRSNIEGICQ